MKRTVVSVLAALLMAGTGMLPTPAVARLAAQATINTTTLAAAASATQTTVSVASASTLAAGQILYVDREAMAITGVSGTTVTVQRGVSGTLATRHASGALVYTGPPNYFAQNDVWGPCTASNEVALPHINVGSGNVFQCANSVWSRYANDGLQQFSAGSAQTYSASGAITIQPGLSLIGGSGALAMTLAAPTAAQDGMIMAIFASAAQAHTITNTAGFNGGTTARDVCTLGGAVGDGIVVQAWGGIWYVLANRNCTLA